MQGFKYAHEIDFQLYGDDMQFVEIELDPRESVIAEAGAMMYMEQGIQMETIFGDGSGQEQSGLMGKLLGAGKRLVTGESLFMTMFTNGGQGKQKVAFAAPYPGRSSLWIYPLMKENHLSKRCISLCGKRCFCRY